MQCTKRDVFMTFVFDFGAFHLVKRRAIVKLTILSKYIKQRPVVKFERLPSTFCQLGAHDDGFICKIAALSQCQLTRVDVTFQADQAPESWKRHWQSRAQAHAVLFLSFLLFKNNKVECLRAKHSLWAEIHLASSPFALFVPSGTIKSPNGIVYKQPFYFQSLESGFPIYWLCEAAEWWSLSEFSGWL